MNWMKKKTKVIGRQRAMRRIAAKENLFAHNRTVPQGKFGLMAVSATSDDGMSELHVRVGVDRRMRKASGKSKVTLPKLPWD